MLFWHVQPTVKTIRFGFWSISMVPMVSPRDKVGQSFAQGPPLKFWSDTLLSEPRLAVWDVGLWLFCEGIDGVGYWARFMFFARFGTHRILQYVFSFYFLTFIGLSSVPGSTWLHFLLASAEWFSPVCQGELFTVNLLCRNFFWEQSSMWPEDGYPTHLRIQGSLDGTGLDQEWGVHRFWDQESCQLWWIEMTLKHIWGDGWPRTSIIHAFPESLWPWKPLQRTWRCHPSLLWLAMTTLFGALAQPQPGLPALILDHCFTVRRSNICISWTKYCILRGIHHISSFIFISLPPVTHTHTLLTLLRAKVIGDT